ncbi:MAG TPA: FAD-dependent oxidoreductase [Allosphingosinicella sp.]|jgi:NADPH-dependent 2,4-dienoyl-CoA reductase/sulfur reductase-like enzyme/nitrite reductase/ring-hydroxylating ferredoxin subunit
MSESGTDDAPTGPDLNVGVPLAEIPATGFLAGHVDRETILLSRSGDGLHAIGGRCTHYGGPLAEGLVVGETVRCPWHHACFSLRTGIALKAPAFDPLDRWQPEIEGGRVFVRTRIGPAEAEAPRPGGPERVVIVGGGAAGFAAAEMLRRLGYGGSLVMLSEDPDPPCDRPNLSKDYLAGHAEPEWIPLKGPDFYEAHKIDLRLGSRVAAIDVAGRKVVMADGDTVDFDRLLIATGAEPVRLKLPGFDRPNVLTLRSVADADRLIERAEQSGSVAVIGAGFIGLEAAAPLRGRGLDVHVVAPEALPMERILGDLGRFIQGLHERHGVQFHLGRKPASYDGESLALDDGTSIAADFLLVGVGVRPRVALATEAGLAVDNGILVDDHLETSASGIFAAGDVANYPHPLADERVRTEHWIVAERQGQSAARAMLGAREPYHDVPFFWTRQFDISIHYVGHGGAWDDAVVSGSIEEGDCSVHYRKDGMVRAAAFVGRPMESLAEGARVEAAIQKSEGLTGPYPG